MYFVLKSFLKYKNIDKTFTGGISSFLLVNMIVFYLQCQYKAQTHKAFMQDHILRFMDFYGKELDNRRLGISIREGGFIFSKDSDLGKMGSPTGDHLCVESPLQPTEDIGASVRNYKTIKKLFSELADVVRDRLLASKTFVRLVVAEPELLMSRHFCQI